MLQLVGLMNRSSDFQTGGLVLLASTVMCGGLAVAIAVPMLSGSNVSQGDLKAQPTAVTLDQVQSDQAYAEFYPTVQTANSVSPSNVGNSSRKMLADRYGELTPGAMSAVNTANHVNGNAGFAPHSSAVSAVPRRLSTSHAPTSAVRPRKVPDRKGGSRLYTDSTSESVRTDAYATLPLQDRHDYSPGVTSSYRPRTVAPHPGGTVYAPVTVHPVTVNVDGGVFASQMATMTKRFEELLEARDAVPQKAEPVEPVSTNRRVQGTERRSVRSAVSRAHTEQLDQLNRRLRDIAESFERFQNQTQRTVVEISNEGRRTEIAFEEIRSVQRQLESQIERARPAGASAPGMVHLPMTHVPAAPANAVPEFPPFETPAIPAVSGTAAAPTTGAGELSPPSNSAFSQFEIPATEFQGDPFSAGEAGSGEQVHRSPGTVPGQGLPAAKALLKVSETSDTNAESERFEPEQRLPDPVEPVGVSIAEPEIQQPNEGFDASQEEQIPPQANNAPTLSVRDANESDLLLAYKARRLMQEAEEALEAGDTVIACTRAMQARSLAMSGGLKASRLDPLVAENQPVDGLLPLPPVDAVSVVDSVSDNFQNVDSKPQQTPRLVVQARAAIAARDFRLALDLADQAEALGATYEAHEDSPTRLREDIAWLTGVRVPASVVVHKSSRGEASKHADQSIPAAGESVITPLVKHADSEERNSVKPVAFEHAYRFELTDVEPAPGTKGVPSLNGIPCKQCGKIHGPATSHQRHAPSKSTSAAVTGPEDRRGRNAARRSRDPQSDDRSQADAVWDALAFSWLDNGEPSSESSARREPAQQSEKKKLFAPHGARRSNRRVQSESNDTAKAHVIWNAPVLQPSSGASAPDEPSQLHRLTSAIRRIGKSATE